MKAIQKTLRFLLRLLAAALCLLPSAHLHGQWSFLGPQWLTADSVGSHAIAFNHQRQAHVAATSLGAATVLRYDGVAWQAIGAGLPVTGQQACALAIDVDDIPQLALGPNLSLYHCPNGVWTPVPGLPAADAHGIDLECTADGERLLAWWQPGVVDSTFVLSDHGGATWYAQGAFAGRLLEMGLDDDGDPVVLLQDATTLLLYNNGTWQSSPPFIHPDESYVDLALSHDGTGQGAVVLRRDASDALSVETLQNGFWVQLGNDGFATGDHYDLGVSTGGTCHLVSVAQATDGLPQVHRFTGGNWQLLGGQYVYNNTVGQPRLAFDPGAAFVLFSDAEQSDRSSVMYFGNPVGAEASVDAHLGVVYPNPVTDVVHLRLREPQAGATLHVCDAMGRDCGAWALTGRLEQEMDVRALRPGQYWLVLQHPLHPMQMGSFTKID